MRRKWYHSHGNDDGDARTVTGAVPFGGVSEFLAKMHAKWEWKKCRLDHKKTVMRTGYEIGCKKCLENTQQNMQMILSFYRRWNF